MRTLAIGDIHGCHTALVTLLKSINLTPADTIVFLGDNVDRGPASREVVETLLALKKSCIPIFLRGNHEAMILTAREDFTKNNSWQACGGFETVCSYGAKYRCDWASRIPDAHWEFFEATQKFLRQRLIFSFMAAWIPSFPWPISRNGSSFGKPLVR